MKKYFVQSEFGFDLFETEEEAIKEGNNIIQEYLEDGEWSEEIEFIYVGTITHQSTKTNIINKPDPATLEDGTYDPDTGIDWTRFDEMCEYEMKEAK